MSMNTKKKLYCIISVNVILALTVPYIITSSYSILTADDFSYAQSLLSNASGGMIAGFINNLSNAFHLCVDVYFNWQGTYFANFMEGLMNPANGAGMSQLKIAMVCNAILLFFSLSYLVFSLTKSIRLDLKFSLYILLLLVYSVTNFDFYQEALFWFTGAVTYTLPFSLMLIALASFIQYNNLSKKKFLYASIICGICSMGGSLSITGTGCYLLLLMCAYYILKNRKISIANIIIFSIQVICAFINALAPGNFKRHGTSDNSGLHPHMALRISLENIDSRLDYLTENTVFVAILLLFFVCGLLIGRRQYNHIKEYLIISFLALFTPIVTCFPVALGYSSNYFPNRCVFVLDWTLILTISNFVIAIGCFVTSRLKFEHLSEISVVLSVVAVCFILSDYEAVANSPTVEISKQLCDGTYSNYYAQYLNVLDELSSYPQGSDVVIYSYKLPYDIPYYFNFYLMEESSNWVNVDMASYFGYNSITVSNEIPQ